MGGILLSADVTAGVTPQPTLALRLRRSPDPELPSFRFPLGSRPTKTFNGGTAKEATVVEFPVSEKLAGVYMTLEPGGLRELHWHANAAEWAYVIEGRCRVTTIDPENRCEIVDFSPGDVWYFPRGHGHLIQGLGPGTCIFVLVFDNGYFSEFGTFSITDWIGHTPPEVLAKTFNLPAETFADFPKKEVYIATGPVPPPLPQESAQGSLDAPPLTHRYQLLAQKPDAFAGGTMRTVSEAEFPISTTITGALLIIEPGALREAALASERRRVAILFEGKRTHDRLRLAWARAHRRVFARRCRLRAAGYGHYIENTGSDNLEVVLALNNATYQSVSITAWIAANPDLLLSTNFGVPESVFAKFPSTR